MSKIIRAEELADIQAWMVPEVQSSCARQSKPLTARQLEEIQQQAREEGYQQGVLEGRAAGEKEFLARIQLMESALASLDRPFEQLDEAVEQQLVQLAMLVARQLVRRELKIEPAQVIGVVREALAVLPVSARNVRLALHPEDARLVRDSLAVQQDSGGLQIVDDPVQTRGGCRVVTENSQIDATVETRLNAVIANVLGGERVSDAVDEE